MFEKTGRVTMNTKKSFKLDHKLKFYILMLIFPLAQLAVFYFAVNVNSIKLAFEEYDMYNNSYTFVGLKNFSQVINVILNESFMKTAFVNTFMIFGIGLIIMIIPILLSYFIFKKYFLHGFFKVCLFLPSVISSMSLVLCFKYGVDVAIPEIWKLVFGIEVKGLLSNNSTTLWVLIFYSVWFSAGSNFLLYLGAMSGISYSVIEAAQMDGVTPFQEFTKIIFPLIFPTFSTFLVTSFAGLFSNQLNLFTFYGERAEYRVYTIGYYLYKSVYMAQTADYPYLSALGLMLTCVAIPLCFITKKLLAKIGPSVE